MNPNPHFPFPDRLKSKGGFTLTELLVVIAVIALLFTLRLSALPGTRDQTLRGQCAGHLRQMALATTIIANDNGDKLLVNTFGNWAWDMSWNVGNTLTNYMPLQTLYCPASGFNYDDNNRLWVYNLNEIHVIGYFQTFPGTADVFPTNLNTTLTPQRVQLSGGAVLTPLASQRVLFADAVISTSNLLPPTPADNFTDVAGAYAKHHRTSHMDGALPAGGNAAMLDGHVEWRSFSVMVSRGPGASGRYWWW